MKAPADKSTYILLTGHSELEPDIFRVPAHIVYVPIAACARTTSESRNRVLTTILKNFASIKSLILSKSTTKFEPGDNVSDMVIETYGNDTMFHGKVKLPLAPAANLSNRQTIRGGKTRQNENIRLSKFLQARSDYLTRQINEGKISPNTKHYIIVNACSGIPGINISNVHKTIKFLNQRTGKQTIIRAKIHETIENALRRSRLSTPYVKRLLLLYEREKKLHAKQNHTQGLTNISNTRPNISVHIVDYLTKLTNRQFKQLVDELHTYSVSPSTIQRNKPRLVRNLGHIIMSRPNLNISRTVQNIQQRIRVGGRGAVEYI
jgi:hypothetical protein